MTTPVTTASNTAAVRSLRITPISEKAKPEVSFPVFARDEWKTTNTDRSDALAREMVQPGSDLNSSRPHSMGPHGNRANPYKKPSKGITVGTDLGDGWRLEGSASPRHHGTVRVGVRLKF